MSIFTTPDSALSRYLRKVVLLGMLAGGIVCAFAAVWTWSRTETYVRHYRLTTFDGDVPTPEQMAETVAVLKARAKSLGPALRVGRCGVAAVPPDGMELTVRTPIQANERELALAWLTMPGRVEFRLLDSPHPLPDDEEQWPPVPDNCRVKTYRKQEYLLASPGDVATRPIRYVVRDDAGVLVGGLAGATLETIGIEKVVVLTFKLHPDDAEALAGLTVMNLGRGMAMFVDGEMFVPPMLLKEACTTGYVQMSGIFYLPPLRKLVKVLDTGALPGRLTPDGGYGYGN
jgi:preprotein translocase subunit SecD